MSKDTLVWLSVDVSTVPAAQAALDKVLAAQQAASAAKAALEAVVKPLLEVPAGQTVVTAVKYGKLSVAFTHEVKAKSKAAAITLQAPTAGKLRVTRR